MKRNEIVDYEVKDSDGNVMETLPMLVVHVNENEDTQGPGGQTVKNESKGTVTGLVFHTDGTTEHVVFNPEQESAEKTDRAEYEEWKANRQAPTGGVSTMGQETTGQGDTAGQTVGGPATGTTPAAQDTAGNREGGNQ